MKLVFALNCLSRKVENQVAPARSEVQARYETEETALPYTHYRRDPTSLQHQTDRNFLRREEYYAEDGDVYLPPAPPPPHRSIQKTPKSAEWMAPEEDGYSVPPDSDR